MSAEEATGKQLAIAVALFEKGYASEAVEGALANCGSLSKALKWLRAEGAAVATSGPQATKTLRKQPASARATPQRSSALSHQLVSPQQVRAVATPIASSPGPRLSGQEETCQICFDEVPAGMATRLGCRHGFYCLDCLRRHTEARITAGQIDVPCPECTTKVQERDLRRLLPASLVERLLSRSLERAVSSITDLRACPTPNCPMRVVVSDHESGWMSCPTCRKQSCVHCGMQPYHRGLTCEEAAQRMRRGSAADVERQTRLFQQWMAKTGTKQCPRCRAPVSKQNLKNQSTQYAECHKMICLNCSTRFCFKCCAVLTDTYSCGCSNALHGFINPKTGRRLAHRAIAKPKAKDRAVSAKAAAKISNARLASKIVLSKAKAKPVGRPRKAGASR